MERQQIIKKILTAGYQLDSEALDFFVKNPKKVEEFFLKKENVKTPTTITLGFLDDLLKEKEPERKINIKDYQNFFNERFGAIKSVFSRKASLTNLISVNKISPRLKNFSIIGMVREKARDGVVLEDTTGKVEIQFKNKDILSDVVEDEVLGVVCEQEGTVVFGENLIFPDIPLKHEVNKTKEDVYCLFLSDFHLNSDSFNKKHYSKFIDWIKNKNNINIFILGDVSSNIEDVNDLLSNIPKSNTTYILRGEIDPNIKNTLQNPYTFQKDGVKIFLFHNPRLNDYGDLWGTPEKAITNLIKKRNLDPIFTPDSKIYERDPYLLEEIPDIIVAGHTHIPSNINYKGITILTTGSFVSQPIFWLMNLRTREILKIDFS
jgi:DNA polymerase II small subunit/DNA polymerase delta subunit B